MPFPLDTSHYRSWIYTDRALAQIRVKVRKDAENQIHKKLKVQNSFNKSQINFPSQEETKLLIDYFVTQILYVCKEKRLEYKVTTTAAAFLNRFFLCRSVLEYDPRRILLTCIMLASKIEESPVLIKTFCDGLIDNVDRLGEILNLELVVLEALNFQLLILNARAPIHYLTTQYFYEKKSQTNADDLGELVAKVNKEAEQLALQAYIGDLYFTYTPSQIAVAAFLQVATSVLADVYEFFQSHLARVTELFALQNQTLTDIHTIRTQLTLMIEKKTMESEDQISQLVFKTIKKIEKINKLINKSKLKDKTKSETIFETKIDIKSEEKDDQNQFNNPDKTKHAVDSTFKTEYILNVKNEILTESKSPMYTSMSDGTFN